VLLQSWSGDALVADMILPFFPAGHVEQCAASPKTGTKPGFLASLGKTGERDERQRTGICRAVRSDGEKLSLPKAARRMHYESLHG
jgi:hypothetical protein